MIAGLVTSRPFSDLSPLLLTHLIAGGTARFKRLGVVTAAIDLIVLEEIDEVHEQLGAGGAREACRVPTHVMPGPGREHRHVPHRQVLPTLKQEAQGVTKATGNMYYDIKKAQLHFVVSPCVCIAHV